MSAWIEEKKTPHETRAFITLDREHKLRTKVKDVKKIWIGNELSYFRKDIQTIMAEIKRNMKATEEDGF